MKKNYYFKIQNRPIDLWQLSLYGIYENFIGFIHLVYTVAMILLSIRFFGQVNLALKLVLILATSLFVVIQPLAIYLRAKKQVGAQSETIQLSFDVNGIHVQVNNETTYIKWKEVIGISKKPTMVVIMTPGSRGFILNNQVLGDEKDDFYQDILARLQNNRKS